jgi:hypothetical protein
MEKPEVKTIFEQRKDQRIENAEAKLIIPEWDPKRFFNKFLKDYGSFTAIIQGCRMSGKSNLLKFFLTKAAGGKLIEKFDTICIFSKTILNGHYQKFIKSKLMFDEFKPDVLEALKQMHEQRKKEGKSFRFLVIFDDMITNNIKYQESITSFFYNSRHYGGSIFFLTQKASEVATGWRNNTMLFIVLKSMSRKEKKFIAESIIADAIEAQVPAHISEAELYRIGTRLQTKLLEDYNAIVLTPWCKRKIKQFKAPCAK